MSRAFRLGVFVLATLLMFGAGVFWIGSRKFLFNSTYRLYADFPTVAGLSDGGDVRVGGVRQGSVRHVYLPHSPDRKVRVEMDLKMPTRDVVKRDSLAAIRTEGLVGDQYVEISFGSTGAPSVRNGDTIGAQPPLELADLLKKTNGILDSAKGAVDNVGGAAGNLNAISSKINRGSGSVGALINDRSIYEHVDAAAAALQEDTEAMKHNFLTRGFFKKRGYEDETELTKYAIRALPSAAYEKHFVYPGNKLFDKQDSAKTKKAKLLDEAGAYLRQHPFGVAVVAAYADQKGDSDKQNELTQARAMVAREYLVDHFNIDDTRIRTLGGGKSANAMEGGQVEVLVYPAKAENLKTARAK
jgi:phospholipid/cholesterol/gamma-HCH transport system substrate-binding protein